MVKPVNFSKRLGLFALLLGFLLLASPLLVASQGFSVVKEPFMVSDPNNDLDEERSIVAVDNNGNAHLIWIDNDGRYLFYAMFDEDGNTLIAPTKLLYLGIYYKTFGAEPERYTVIEWKVIHYNNGKLGRFQAVLYENGTIDINILDSSGAEGETSITGVNKGDGTHGVDIGVTPSSLSSYRFTWDDVAGDYTWSQISFNWIDASDGTPVGAEEDDSSAPVPIGFDFTFYGTSYNTVYVSSNGYMSFTITSPTSTNGPSSFPSSDSYTADVIAPLWTDWRPDKCYRKPKLAVDDSNYLHIVYHSYMREVSYFKVDPYRDDLDGDEADPANIIVVEPTIVSVDDDVQSVAPAIAAGSAVHIVWRDGSYDEQGAIWYTKLDEDGNVLIAPVMLTDQVMFPDYSNEPSIAVDSQGNVHIVWNDYWETSSTEIAYMLVDGSDGSVLIDKTLLTPDDDEKGRRPMVVVDSQDCAHIVWQDRRSGTTEIYYTKINPYLDDLSGDAADPDTITIIDDTRLSEEDGYKSKCPAVTIDQYDRLSIIWWDEKWLDAADSELSYMALDSDGATLVEETRITWDGPDIDKYDSWFVPWIAAGGGVRVFITYTAESNDNYNEEVWLIILEFPPPGALPVGGYITPAYEAPTYGTISSTTWISLIALATIVTTFLYTKYRRK